jgi:GntP family gluconate:H+ symporter
MGETMTMLAMGSGSMFVSHANDSYFWVVNNFSELEVDTTLKVHLIDSCHGYCCFACVWITSLFVL